MAHEPEQGEMEIEQRVLAALRCEQPDRVPVLTYFNPYLDGWYTHLPPYAEILTASREYGDAVFEWEFPAPLMHTGGARWIEQRDLGNGQTEQIIHTPDGPITEVVRADWREHEVVKRWIQTVEDAERALSLSTVAIRPDLEGFFAIKAQLTGKAVSQVTFHEPIALTDWIDERALVKWRVENRDLFRRLLDVAFERLTDGLATCLAAGVGPVYVLRTGQFSGRAVASPDDFEEFVLEYDRRLVDQIHTREGTYVVLQAGERTARVLDKLGEIGMDGVSLLEPPLSGEFNLAHVKARIGDRVCLIANLPHEELTRGSTAQIERLIQHTLAAGAAGGGLILNPCPSPRGHKLSDQASANLVHYLKTAHALGRYPVRL